MNKRIKSFGVGLLLCSGAAIAETAYVSDQLEATMRRGEGTKFGIVRMVKSGYPLNVVEVNSKTGYTKVRTNAGTEGYVLSRYLMSEAPAREQLGSLTDSNKGLREKIENLEATIAELQGSTSEQSGQIAALQSDKQELGLELTGLREATSDVIAIKRKNDTFSAQVQQLTIEKEALETENRAYRDNTKQDWFVRGAGVIILGILIGLILPKLRRRRRWGDL